MIRNGESMSIPKPTAISLFLNNAGFLMKSVRIVKFLHNKINRYQSPKTVLFS